MKKNLSFYAMLFAFGLLAFIRFFQFGLTSSYRIPLLSGMEFEGTYVFTIICRMAYLALGLILCVVANEKIHSAGDMDDTVRTGLGRNVIILFAIFAFPMYAELETFGNYDMYLSMVLFASMILILLEKGLWLLLPLSLAGIYFHPSYLFKCLPLVIICLGYFLHKNNKKNSLLYLTILTSLAYFLWKEYHAYFSLDVAGSSILPSWQNGRDFLLELLLSGLVFLPYLIYGILLYREIRKASAYAYRLGFLSGLACLLFVLLMKFAIGTVLYYTFLYVLLLLLFFIEQGEDLVLDTMHILHERVSERVPLAVLLLVYPIIFMPFGL